MTGGGHTITGLVINRPSMSYVGLFGRVISGGAVRNLGLVGGVVTGRSYVGGLVGLNFGTVSNAYATGTVTGSSRVGGLVGGNAGTVSNAYATGAVTGTGDFVGGLVGGNSGTVSNAFAAGVVTGTGYYVGGMVGYNGSGSVSMSYWDIQTSGWNYSEGGTGKTTAEMKQQATFVDWDFQTIWGIQDNVTYPYLQSFPALITITPDSGINTGPVAITNLAGNNFQSGATVKLSKTGQPDIIATEVNVVSTNQITCTFDLTDKALGLWNVMVTNPNGLTGILPNGFAISRVIYVSPAGDDSNTGLSWTLAKKTLTAGLNAAIAGDQVWVAAGTYNECITLTAGVAIYGGFAGTETLLAQRSISGNPTILDGQQSGTVVTSPPGATASTRIDGFTIQNGNATNGGGICCSFSSPSIANNTISGNHASSANGGNGGGIYCTHSSPTIRNNTISGNTVGSMDNPAPFAFGGGIYFEGSSPIITGNKICNNVITSQVYGGGGGMACFSTSPTIANNEIRGNIARVLGNTGAGGGIFCVMDTVNASISMVNNLISENSTEVPNGSGAGGGIFFSSEYADIKVDMIGNTITGNTSSYGGGISIFNCGSGSLSTIANNIIAFNSSGITNSAEQNPPILRNNCVFNPNGTSYSGLSAGATDIQQNPLFVNQAGGDFHLTWSSPCRDAGSDSDVQSGWLDMDGQARIFGSHVDIGADEFDSIPGDCDGNGKVDYADFVTLKGNFGKTNMTWAQGDFDGNGKVDYGDFVTLKSNFGKTGGVSSSQMAQFQAAAEAFEAAFAPKEVAQEAQETLQSTVPCSPLGLILMSIAGLALYSLSSLRTQE